MNWIVSKEESGLLLIDFFKKKRLPKKIWRQMKCGRYLSFQNKLFLPGDLVIENQLIDLSEYYQSFSIPSGIQLDIIYETDRFLIVNKPSGLLVHPISSTHESTLNDLVKNYYYQNRIPALPHPVIRLDRGTSGLVLYAKRPSVQAFFQRHSLQKEYLAVVEGSFPLTTFTVTGPIRRAPNSIIERNIGLEGKSSATIVEVLTSSNSLSLLKCTLLTGRTHQIRVHLSSIGSSIYGDSLYGFESPISPFYGLHAWKLSYLAHNSSEKSFSVSSSLPDYIQRLFPDFNLY